MRLRFSNKLESVDLPENFPLNLDEFCAANIYLRSDSLFGRELYSMSLF